MVEQAKEIKIALERTRVNALRQRTNILEAMAELVEVARTDPQGRNYDPSRIDAIERDALQLDEDVNFLTNQFIEMVTRHSTTDSQQDAEESKEQ